MTIETLFPPEKNIYKVLTLWQPWATLLAIGAKKIETRPSPTNWTIERGSYLIHAARKWTSELDAISKGSPFKESLKGHQLSLGCIIGSIEVLECKPIFEDQYGEIKLIDIYKDKRTLVTGNELAFGDYREGRYAWICQNPKMFKIPISYKNGQGYYQNFKGDINLLSLSE